MWAADHGRVEIVTLLLDRGTGIGHMDSVSHMVHGVTVLSFNQLP